MTRLLFIIILFVVSYLVIKSFLSKLEKNKKIGQQQRTDKTKMLKCEECGLHIPEHEAIRQGDHVFCSLEHARQRLE